MILDASAVIVLFRDEPGREVVEANLDEAIISAVNLAEAAEVMIRSGYSDQESMRWLRGLQLDVAAPTATQAFAAARLARQTKAFGLSLGDRFCISLAMERGLPALTADRAWADLDIEGLQVELVR
jgi:ribonuclease VapC